MRRELLYIEDDLFRAFNWKKSNIFVYTFTNYRLENRAQATVNKIYFYTSFSRVLDFDLIIMSIFVIPVKLLETVMSSILISFLPL